MKRVADFKITSSLTIRHERGFFERPSLAIVVKKSLFSPFIISKARFTMEGGYLN